MTEPKKRRAILVMLVVAMLSMFAIAPAGSAAAAPEAPAGVFTDIPITGTIANGGGTFTGTLDIVRFVTGNGQVQAAGLLSGTLRDPLGNVIGTVTDVPVLIPVAFHRATCEILHLVLGPLSLELLGLNVDLSRVVLEITAESGPGKLLGNLLCAIAHLLDHGPQLGSLTQLLNSLLRILG